MGKSIQEEEPEYVEPEELPHAWNTANKFKIGVQSFRFFDNYQAKDIENVLKPKKNWFSTYKNLILGGNEKDQPVKSEVETEDIYDSMWKARRTRRNHVYLYWDYTYEDPFADLTAEQTPANIPVNEKTLPPTAMLDMFATAVRPTSVHNINKLTTREFIEKHILTKKKYADLQLMNPSLLSTMRNYHSSTMWPHYQTGPIEARLSSHGTETRPRTPAINARKLKRARTESEILSLKSGEILNRVTKEDLWLQARQRVKEGESDSLSNISSRPTSSDWESDVSGMTSSYQQTGGSGENEADQSDVSNEKELDNLELQSLTGVHNLASKWRERFAGKRAATNPKIKVEDEFRNILNSYESSESTPGVTPIGSFDAERKSLESPRIQSPSEEKKLHLLERHGHVNEATEVAAPEGLHPAHCNLSTAGSTENLILLEDRDSTSDDNETQNYFSLEMMEDDLTATSTSSLLRPVSRRSLKTHDVKLGVREQDIFDEFGSGEELMVAGLPSPTYSKSTESLHRSKDNLYLT